MKKFEVNDIVKWCIDYTTKEKVGEFVTQPFLDFPDIWLVKPYSSDELVLVSEEDLEHI
jgi:hypothetical protein